MTSYDYESLTIPTQEEAKYYVEQNVGMDGGNSIVFPVSYSLITAVKKGLTNLFGFGEEYLYLQALYRAALEQYLMETLSLKEYDDRIAASENRIIPREGERRNFYQKYSTMGLTYVYLRNNLPIERLEKEDLEILRDCLETADTQGVTEELMEMVQRTYPTVLKAYTQWEDDDPAGYSYDGSKTPPTSR